MKTIVYWKAESEMNGLVEEFDGLLPSVQIETQELDLLDEEMGVRRTLELEKVDRFTFVA